MKSNNIDRIVWAVCYCKVLWWFSNIYLYLLAKGTKRKLKDSGKLSKKVKLADLDSDEDDDEDDEDYEEDMSALDFLDEASEDEEDSDDMCKT